MKPFLSLILVVTFGVVLHAATPQLTNFNAKQFIVTPTAAPTNVIKLRLNPSQFDTNASSITITNGAGGGGTNVFNTIITTNLTVVSNLTVINNITLGGTNVAAINPTIGRYPYNQDGTNFGDGSLRWVDPTTSATETFIVDDLAGGGVVVSEAVSGVVTNLPAGSGALTNDGAGNLGWMPFPAGATFNPTAKYVPVYDGTGWQDSYFYTNGANMALDVPLIFGPGTTNIFFRNPSNILVYSNGIPVMQALDSGGRTLEWGVQSTIPFVSGTSALELFGGTGSGLVLDSGAHAIYPVTGGVGEDLGTATKYYGSLYLTNQIVFGPGTTNYAQKLGGGLLLAGGNSIDFMDNATGKSMRFGSSALLMLDSAIDIGSGPGGGAYPARDVKLSRELQLQGYYNGFDYSYMSAKSTGTNAWDTHQFNSISAGAAGTAGRPFQFTNAPVMLPYVTKAEKTSLVPIDGMVVYQTDNTPGLRAYIGGAWVMVSTVADP